MKLRIVTPLDVVVDQDGVTSVRAEVEIDQRQQTFESTLEVGQPMTLTVDSEPNRLRSAAPTSVPMKSKR